MGAMDTDGKFGFFSGANAPATLVTGEAGATTGRFTYLDGVYPIVDTATCSVAIATRNLLSEPVAYGIENSPNPVTGNIDFMAEARWFTFRLTIPKDVEWTKAQGIDVPGRPTGWR
jgi:hypothetical protein